MDISKEAYEHIKKIAKSGELFRHFMKDKKYQPAKRPATFFMAGSPGAGKTEFSKGFIKNAYQETGLAIIRIDADEIRELCPGYSGQNSHLFQRAVSFGVSQLYYFTLREKYNSLLDSTFSNYQHAENNVQLALDKEREVNILYVFQEPARAWELTLKREKIENRKITLDVFIKDFFMARKNVNIIKDKYKYKINLILIKKNYSDYSQEYIKNIEKVDNQIKNKYTEESLYKMLKNVKI